MIVARVLKSSFRSCRRLLVGSFTTRTRISNPAVAQRLAFISVYNNNNNVGNSPFLRCGSCTSKTLSSHNNLHRRNSSAAAAAATAATRTETETITDNSFPKSSSVVGDEAESLSSSPSASEWCHDIPASEISRLRHMRNVGIFAHVDAGKTTVTERMLALAGIVQRAGNVDDGNTVTDYLPAERERGITIQSAAIRFPWAFHNAQAGDWANDRAAIALIDTPGHVDFSVEVNRSVAVLDGAVLVVDAAAGVQAQTQTVWRAMTRPSFNNHRTSMMKSDDDTEDQAKAALENDPVHARQHLRKEEHYHEPLPCVALINKMDKVGSNFHSAVQSLRNKLPGANPVPIQLPVFKKAASAAAPTPGSNSTTTTCEETESILHGLFAPMHANEFHSDDFLGILDLVHMRIVIWPDTYSCNIDVSVVENCIPTVIPLWTDDHQLLYPLCPITEVAVTARTNLVETMAEVDELMEEMYLKEQDPTTADLRNAIRRATIGHRILPVMAAAAVQGKGIEPCLDAIADFLPSPIDRMPPSLTILRNSHNNNKAQSNCLQLRNSMAQNKVALGHCFHPTLLALVFKVLHMKGRGGSGDGRVVFARVYSGTIRCRDVVQIIRPPTPGEESEAPRTERVGGMLELTHFCNLENGVSRSGDVCALVGLKEVVTGDTIMMPPSNRGRKFSKAERFEYAYCAGVTAPKPVLTVKLETETPSEQTRLTEALSLLTIEDPSLIVEENDSCTLLSGLGELHIEVILDRIHREHGLKVRSGAPSVAYRETVTAAVETDGLFNFTRTVGGNRLQASIHLKLEPVGGCPNDEYSCQLLTDPVVTLAPGVLDYLSFHDYQRSFEELEIRSPVVRSLLEGCRGALKRGPNGYAMANMKCHVLAIDAECGLSGLQTMPGSLRAAAAIAIQTLLSNGTNACVLEPIMSLELSVPNEMVGSVLSDLTSRRGKVDEVCLGDVASTERKAVVLGEVPLIEILGYAKTLRSLTGGEASFTSEYKGHSPCTL